MPSSIGPYRIYGEIESGGMGTVYKAERRGAVRQLVAIKVVRRGLATKQVLARFALEQRALAAMNHRNIAKVIDAGETEDGAPYFVMEYVEGKPISEHCDRHKLSIGERIELFQQVCRGVQHAHLKGIVHRDLKPNNILVVREGDQFVPKILDFGLAKATNRSLLDITVLTEVDQVMGTPGYMSPEQASGDGEMVDGLSDVYSLGVMLYELLAGDLPYQRTELLQAVCTGRYSLLCEREPPKPSTRIDTVADSATCAERRRTNVAALRRELRGDLDWIVLKAMALEPARRYQSANGLAEDLQRYRDHEPVLAGPPGVGYRVGKLLQKYRIQAVAAAAVFLSLVAGVVASWLYAQETKAFAVTVERQNERFRLLSAGLNLRRAYAKYDEYVLKPVLPASIASLEAWLATDAKGVLDVEPAIASNLEELRHRSQGALVSTMLEDVSSHPRFEELQTLRARVAALEGADLVRQGAGVLMPDLPVALAKRSAMDLNEHAWARCSPDGKQRSHEGKSLEAWAAAAAALDKVRAGDPTVAEHDVLDTLAWALVATGQDEAARRASSEALSKAPQDKRQDFERLYEQVVDAVLRAPQQLKSAREQLAVLESVVGGRQRWRFEDLADQYLHDWLSGLLLDIERFKTQAVVQIEGMLVWARYLEGLRSNAAYVESWRKASSALGIREQVGLWPIGRNPLTGLWEFYHLRSAWDPAMRSEPVSVRVPRLSDYDAKGVIPVHPWTGVVLVYLPGGTYWMGAELPESGGHNPDPHAMIQERPAHEVSVDGFFVARHELTQAQWMRLAQAGNPSQYSPEQSNIFGSPVQFSQTHPVEQVSWTDARRVLRSAGLALPTEEQWEYACRAGSSTPWWTGIGKESLQSGGAAANIADAAALDAKATWSSLREWPEYFDRHPYTAPVDSLLPNPWGLHHVLGNVWEWCEDEYASYSGLESERSTGRTYRGGSYASSYKEARSSVRTQAMPNTSSNVIGIRAARAVE